MKSTDILGRHYLPHWQKNKHTQKHASDTFVQVTHRAERPQWDPARSPAVVKTDRPMRETVGVMVSGPMYFSSRPGNPHRPMITSTRLDMMMAPWICRKHQTTIHWFMWTGSEPNRLGLGVWLNSSSKSVAFLGRTKSLRTKIQPRDSAAPVPLTPMCWIKKEGG